MAESREIRQSSLRHTISYFLVHFQILSMPEFPIFNWFTFFATKVCFIFLKNYLQFEFEFEFHQPTGNFFFNSKFFFEKRGFFSFPSLLPNQFSSFSSISEANQYSVFVVVKKYLNFVEILNFLAMQYGFTFARLSFPPFSFPPRLFCTISPTCLFE